MSNSTTFDRPRPLEYRSKWLPLIRGAHQAGVPLAVWARQHGYPMSAMPTLYDAQRRWKLAARGIPYHGRKGRPTPEPSEKPENSLDGWT